MKKYLLPAIIVLIFTSNVAGQNLWQRTYGTPDDEYATSIFPTSDGGYIITGTQSIVGSITQMYLLKTDSSGDITWERNYGGIYEEEAQDVIQTNDGGYIIVGSTRSFGASYNDIYVVKTNSAGDTVWTRRYGGSGDDKGYGIKQTADDGYIIVGTSTSFGSGDSDVYLIKTDGSGNIDWSNNYGGTADDAGHSVVETPDGDYVIGGVTSSYSSSQDIYILKVDGSGNSLWEQWYGGSRDENGGYSIARTSDGGYILVGSSLSFAVGEPQKVYLIKTDLSGTLQWQRSYNEGGDARGTSVQEVSTGGYIVTGSQKNVSGIENVYIVRTNNQGIKQWGKTAGGIRNDYGNSIQLTTDGNFIIAGYTESFGYGETDNPDIYILKTDTLGNVPSNNPPYFCLCPSDTIIAPEENMRLSFRAFDMNDDSTISVSNYSLIGPTGASLEGDTIVKWTPTTGDIGTHSFSIAACDPSLCDTCQFTVLVDSPPEITACPEDTIIIKVNESDTAEFEVTDVDASSLDFEPLEPSDDSWWTTVFVSDPGNFGGQYNFFPTLDDVGLHLFSFRVCDTFFCDTCDFLVNVHPNDPPEIFGCPGGTLTVEAQETLSFDWSVYDLDYDPLDYELIQYPSPYRGWWYDDFQPVANHYEGDFEFYPAIDNTGIYDFTYVVCDPEVCDTCRFSVWVIPVQPPEITGCPTDTLYVGAGNNYLLNWEAVDPDSAEMNFELREAPSGYEDWCTVTHGPEDEHYAGQFYFHPEPPDTGAHYFKFAVCNPDTCTTCEFIIVVFDNHPVEIHNCPTEVITIPGDPTEFDFYATDPEDYDTLTYQLIEHPSTGSPWWEDNFDTLARTGSFDFFPSCENTGLHHFSYAICDTEFCDTCAFEVDVSNDPPIIEGCPSETVVVLVGDEYTINFSADDTLEAEMLNYNLLEHPEPYREWWLDSVNTGGEVNGYFQLSPTTIEHIGNYLFKFSICDECGACDTCQFVVWITRESDCPCVTNFDASTVSSHEILLSWDYGNGTPDSVYLYRENEEEDLRIASLPGSPHSEYSDSGLPYASPYTYRAVSWCPGVGRTDSTYDSATTYYFRRDHDGFSLTNTYGEIWPPESDPPDSFPDWESFQFAYGDAQVNDRFGNRRPGAIAFWNSLKREWQGSSFGFSAVSLHYFDNIYPYRLIDWGVGEAINIPSGDPIRKEINAGQLRQPPYAQYTNMESVPDYYERFYYPGESGQADAFVDDLAANMIADLQIINWLDMDWGAHSVVPYRIDTISSTNYQIQCYDSWSPYDEFYFDVNTVTDEIIYHRESSYSPLETQSMDYLWITPSRYFSTPPSMDFYSSTGGRDFAGTAHGFRSIFIENIPRGESAFFSSDTFYNTGATYLTLIPNSTPDNPSAPNWGLHLPSSEYRITLMGNESTGGKVFLTTVAELLALDFPDLQPGEVVVIYLSGNSYQIIPPELGTETNISIGSMLDDLYYDEGVFTLNFSTLAGTLTTQVINSSAGRMIVQIDRDGEESSYNFQAHLSNYASSSYPQDTISIGHEIAISDGESQRIDFILRGASWDGLFISDPDGDGTYQDTLFNYLAIDNKNDIPNKFSLSVHPNPFNSTLTVHYSVAFSSNVTVGIYDVMGRCVSKLVDKTMSKGIYSTKWDASDLPSGLYFVLLKADDFSVVDKALLMK